MKKSLQITKWGGPEVLKMVEESPSLMYPKSIRIRVTAAGINFADLMMRMGLYPEAPKAPFTPGYEIAGTVIEVGTDVKSVHPGDRVLGCARFGGYTNQIVLDEFQVRKIPGKLSDIEAAAVPVNFLTAWVALLEMARVRKGDRVLVQSAAGGVGIAAVQIAAQAGAHVVGLVSSKSKASVVKSLGAAEVITYEEWEADVNDELGGFQIILDAQGGDSLKKNFNRLGPAGKIITFGVSNIVTGKKRSLGKLFSFAFQTPFFTSYRLMDENKGVFGLNMLKLFEEPIPGKPHLLTRAFDELLERFEDKSFKVMVGKTYPLEQGGEAQTELQGRSNIGKIVLIPPTE